MVLDTTGGPNWAHNYVESPIIVNATSHEYYKNPMYYALGHFSKYLVPDSVRLGHIEQPKMHKNILVTVFERPDNGTVLTILNRNHNPTSLQVHDPENGFAQIHVKADSLQTLIWY